MDVRIETSQQNIQPTNFPGNGFFHIEFIDSSEPRIIDISFATSILLTQLKLEMPMNRAAFLLNVSAVEQGIQFEDVWTQILHEVTKYSLHHKHP